MTLGVTASATAEPGTVEAKQAQERSIISQIGAIETEVSTAIERWNLANVKLTRIGGNLKRARFELGVARVNFKRAQLAAAKQAVDVYTSGNSDSTLEVILGAASLDDLLNRIDTVNRVNDQQSSVVGDVRSFRQVMAKESAKLHRAQTQQKHVVAERIAEKQSIEAKLAERQRLLQSVRAEIVHLREVERQRQAELARQAAAQQAARQRAAAAAAAAPSVVSATAAPAAPAAATAPAAAPAPTPEPVSAPSSQYGGVVGIAMRYLGTPYVWGGASPSGFDCSGFVTYVFSQVGVSLPHSSYSQYGAGVAVPYNQLQPGDLVFFDGLGHVGIYIGGGSFIHSPHTGDVVKISSMSGWYSSTYVGARRIV